MHRMFRAIAFQRNPSQSYERHLPYGIAQCYMPPDTGDRASP